MDSSFWQNRWRENRIGFHQGTVNSRLRRHFGEIAAGGTERVFIPLCGKSLDILWIADQGHPVIGVELSRIAVEAFFADNGLAPQTSTRGEYLLFKAREIEILCGDFFELTRDDLGGASIVYDRAALVALPEEMRERYAAKMTDLLPEGARILLITFEYPEGHRQGPPFSISREEVERLYNRAFDLRELIDDDHPTTSRPDEPPTMIERTWLLTKR